MDGKYKVKLTKADKKLIKLEKKIQKCKSVYLIVCYAHWCVREYKWTGKWHLDAAGIPEPIVWNYNDHNGAYESYDQLPITYTTTGMCCDWSFHKSVATKIAEQLENS